MVEGIGEGDGMGGGDVLDRDGVGSTGMGVM